MCGIGGHSSVIESPRNLCTLRLSSECFNYTVDCSVLFNECHISVELKQKVNKHNVGLLIIAYTFENIVKMYFSYLAGEFGLLARATLFFDNLFVDVGKIDR